MLVTVECKLDHDGDPCRYQGKTGTVSYPYVPSLYDDAWVVAIDGNNPIFDAEHLVPVPPDVSR
jgi:hypothetical protein